MTYENDRGPWVCWLDTNDTPTTCITRVMPNDLMYMHMSIDMAPLVKLNVMISMGTLIDVECKISPTLTKTLSKVCSKTSIKPFTREIMVCGSVTRSEPNNTKPSKTHNKCDIKSHQGSDARSDTIR